MFAINCLKANGTHLGTCIDKFYFGSCCHIPPVNDLENSIDTDIIPSREPPNRLSTYKPIITTISHESTSTSTTELSTTNEPKTITTTSATKEKKTTTVTKLSTTPKRQHSTKPTVAFDASSSTETTTFIPKLSTFQSIDGAPSTTPLDSTTTLSSTLSPSSQKPTTNITKKPKPISSPKPNLKPSSKPSTKPYTKPYSKPTSKPVKISSRPKPITTSTKPTKTGKPSKSPTRRPVITIKVPISTRKPTTTTKTTNRPSSAATRKPTTTVMKTTSKAPINVHSNSTEKPSPSISTISTASPATVGESVTSSEASLTETSTNYVKPSTLMVTTDKSSFVTWTSSDIKKNSTEEDASISITTEEEWKPMTTPDGWVLLPSVPSEVSSATPVKEETSTNTPQKDKFTTIMYVESTSSTTTKEVNITTHSPPPVSTNATVSSILLQSTTEVPPSTSSPASISSSPATANVPTTDENIMNNPVNMSDFTDVCGRRMYPEARIVGGEKSSFGKWPWQISLRQWRTSTYLHKCGAALLNENWAITAAHCVDNVPPSDLLLRLGEHDLSTESEPYLHQERRVQIVASHPQFDPRTFEYDLALLRFYEPVKFQPNIIPVCVPQSDENFVGRTAYVTGWGRLYEDGPLPSVLQEVSVPVINNSICESMYRSAGYIEHIPHIFICAGWRNGGYDSCEGDSGGPLVIQREDKRFQLAGVISWGIGCAEPNQPGVYTRISEFRDWINQILQF
ncbi:hypothetical protein WA026_002313 [Henosepilachna vigintioctopunctata]|uniref:Peptidase S1 domain-containing protein n=1 Tax=Henosepilachna vigintioctopunctata TaxID=420089 RepID=A0AAW1U0T6_9CUCU